MGEHASHREGRPLTLRRTWRTTVVQGICVLLVIMGLAVGAAAYQRSLFGSTVANLEEETAALVALDRKLLETTGHLTVFLYRAGEPHQTQAARDEYEELRLDVVDRFDSIERALHSSTEIEHAREARRYWDELDAAARASTTEIADEELAMLLVAGDDPFMESVWTPYDQMDLALADVRTASVDGMRSALADASRVQDLIGLGFVGALLLSLAYTIGAIRRMSRRVLGPLEEVGQGARAMRDPLDEHHISVPLAVEEIRQLADEINETSASLRQSHGLLHTQAHTDEMTELPNRKAFVETLEGMLDVPDHGQVAVLFIDLDDFKTVNDTMGHAAGDELLRIVGRRLRSSIRGNEVAARLGGDEFAVAMDVGHDVSAAVVIAERILATLEQPADIDGRAVDVACSIGIAVSDPESTPAAVEDVLGNADFAMYMAKSQGKNRYELYSSSTHAEMLGGMELRRDLGLALDGAQFELRYQPIIDLHSSALTGFEALIRWHHPTRGLLAPMEFIGIAEDTGLIRPIGEWVLDEACRHLSEHHREDPSLVISVNVSPVQLTDPEFVNVVRRTVETRGIPFDKLVLEVTEATAMTNTSSGSMALEELRALGVHVALDDFGTGFSSLQYLGDLPADVIKIDRSFVAGTTDNQRSMLETIISLAQRLGLAIVAEGIERPDELDRLCSQGEMSGQGYLFAAALTAADAVEYRREHTTHRNVGITTSAR